MAKSSRRKSGRTGRGTDAQTAADVQNDLPESDESALADTEADDDAESADLDADDVDSGGDLDDEDLDGEDTDGEDTDDEGDEAEPVDDDDDDEIAAASTKSKKTKSDKGSKKLKATKEVRAPRPAAHAPSGGPVRFVRESVAELSKVVWPTRKQMITYTIVVLVFVVFLVAAIGFYDLGISKLMMVVFG